MRNDKRNPERPAVNLIRFQCFSNAGSYFEFKVTMDINEVEKGDTILVDNRPYRVLDAEHSFRGRGRARLQARLKDLQNGTIISQTFKPADTIEPADIESKQLSFIYCHRGTCVFADPDDRSQRFSCSEESIRDELPFLLEHTTVTAHFFDDDLLAIDLPVKAQYKVVEAPPNVKGNTAEGGEKPITLETGLEISAPLFVEAGDTVEVNTETGEYVRRVQSA